MGRKSGNGSEKFCERLATTGLNCEVSEQFVYLNNKVKSHEILEDIFIRSSGERSAKARTCHGEVFACFKSKHYLIG